MSDDVALLLERRRWLFQAPGVALARLRVWERPSQSEWSFPWLEHWTVLGMWQEMRPRRDQAGPRPNFILRATGSLSRLYTEE